MRRGKILAALRRPLNRRIPIRRSTLIMVVLFVVLAGLEAYHSYVKPPPSTTVCVGDHCATVRPNQATTADAHGTTTTTTDPRSATAPPTRGAEQTTPSDSTTAAKPTTAAAITAGTAERARGPGPQSRKSIT